MFVAVVACWLATTMAVPGLARAEDTYSIGVVPQYEPRKLFSIWQPIVEDLHRRTGIAFTLDTTPTIAGFEQALDEGRYDFVYANPYLILKEVHRQGYLPLVRDAQPLTGLVVVAADSPVTEVGQLDGKVLAVPSANAMGASLLIQADLARLFHVRMRLLNAKTHTAAYLQVAGGQADAGGGVQKTLEAQPESVRSALRVIYRTREVPSHPVAAHARVPAAVRQAVKAALLAMAADPQGAALLAQVPMAKPVATGIADYQPMADWGLDEFWVDNEP